MKKLWICLFCTAALSLCLAACSSAGEPSGAPSQSPIVSAQPSPTSVVPTTPGNDAASGGGAGGTNDLDNNGVPDSVQTPGSGFVNDIENGLENAADGVRRALR